MTNIIPFPSQYQDYGRVRLSAEVELAWDITGHDVRIWLSAPGFTWRDTIDLAAGLSTKEKIINDCLEVFECQTPPNSNSGPSSAPSKSQTRKPWLNFLKSWASLRPQKAISTRSTTQKQRSF